MMARFADVLTIVNGKNQSKVENPNGKYPIYGSGGIMGYADDYICEANTVIIGRKGSINKPIFVETPFWNVDTAFGLVADKTKLLPKYLFYFCDYFDFEQLNTTVTIPSLTKANLLNVKIPLPSLSKQEKILSELSKIDTLISLRKQQLAKLDDLVKARFVELFGDVSDFVNITDIAHTYIGLVTTMTKHYCNNGTPLLFNSSIKSDKIVWDGTYLDAEFAEANKSRMHKTNDIITVHTGDIGTSAVVGEEYNNSLGFATIVTRINDVGRYYPRFISSFLNYGSGKEQLKKYSRDVRNNLNLKDFNRLMVPNVSVLDQKRYVDFLEQTDKSKSAIQQSLDKLETLKGALMQKYFG